MAQWLHVGDNRYPNRGFEDLDLEQLDKLEDESGLSIDDLVDIFEEAAADSQRYFATKQRRTAIKAWVWAVRTVAGESLSLSEAIRGIPVGSIWIEDDEPEPEPASEAEPDPTAAASDPAA